ncbi:MAG: hypothetical protein QXD23_00460 [Candidatus Micrarchaeaceae archaeon]
MAMKTDMFIFVIFIAIGVLFSVGVLVNTNPILIVIFSIFALFFSILGFSTRYYTYLYLPLFKSRKKNIILNNKEAFILSPSGNTIIVNDESGTYATAFVKIPIYRSSTEMTDPEKLDLGRTFSRVLTLTKETTKFCSEIYVVNKDDYISRVRVKLEEVSEKLRTEQTNGSQTSDKLNRLKGELTMWENLISNISSSRSESLITYNMVSAFGENEEEASSIAYQKAEEIVAGISAALGISAYIVEGEELLSLIEPNYMIPVETINEIIRQKSIKEGL